MPGTALGTDGPALLGLSPGLREIPGPQPEGSRQQRAAGLPGHPSPAAHWVVLPQHPPLWMEEELGSLLQRIVGVEVWG